MDALGRHEASFQSGLASWMGGIAVDAFAAADAFVVVADGTVLEVGDVYA